MGVYIKGMTLNRLKQMGIAGIQLNINRLVEVPEPHGRLIDADVALENIDMADGGPCYVGKEGLDNTPTVIEAESE